jgi:hypothetical protein
MLSPWHYGLRSGDFNELIPDSNKTYIGILNKIGLRILKFRSRSSLLMRGCIEIQPFPQSILGGQRRATAHLI